MAVVGRGAPRRPRDADGGFHFTTVIIPPSLGASQLERPGAHDLCSSRSSLGSACDRHPLLVERQPHPSLLLLHDMPTLHVASAALDQVPREYPSPACTPMPAPGLAWRNGNGPAHHPWTGQRGFQYLLSGYLVCLCGLPVALSCRFGSLVLGSIVLQGLAVVSIRIAPGKGPLLRVHLAVARSQLCFVVVPRPLYAAVGWRRARLADLAGRLFPPPL